MAWSNIGPAGLLYVFLAFNKEISKSVVKFGARYGLLPARVCKKVCQKRGKFVYKNAETVFYIRVGGRTPGPIGPASFLLYILI